MEEMENFHQLVKAQKDSALQNTQASVLPMATAVRGSVLEIF